MERHNLLTKHVDLEKRTAILDQVNFGCNEREWKLNKKSCRGEHENVRNMYLRRSH